MLIIYKFNNIGNIDIEIGGIMFYMEYDMFDLLISFIFGGMFNVMFVYGFEFVCLDVFDIIFYVLNMGIFLILNLLEGFFVEYLADKVVFNYGQIGIFIDNISEVDCGNIICIIDDIFIVDVMVIYGYLFGSGMFILIGLIFVGLAFVVNVADFIVNVYIFIGVILAVDGSDIDLMVFFFDGCDYNDSLLGIVFECGGIFIFVDIIVFGFGCFGLNGIYIFVGYEGGVFVWQFQNDFFIGYVEGEWVILFFDFLEEVIFWFINLNGFIDNLFCNNGWIDLFECVLFLGVIVLSGGCGNFGGGSGLVCELMDIVLFNISVCDDNGIISSIDDYFIVDVMVIFVYVFLGVMLMF